MICCHCQIHNLFFLFCRSWDLWSNKKSPSRFHACCSSFFSYHKLEVPLLRLHRIGLPGTQRVPRFNASEPTRDPGRLLAIKRDKMFETAKSMIQSCLGKVVWTTAIMSIKLARLPFWLLYYATRNLRQHAKWTYLQAIKHRLVRILVYH